MMSSLLDKALDYAKEEIKVFPMFQTSCIPAIESWNDDASDDVNQIMGWWNHNSNYNIGLRTGHGLIIIDVKNLKQLEDDAIKKFFDLLPSTLVVQTPKKGWHLYFYVEKKVETKLNIYKDIDVHGEDSYVMGAGSIIGDIAYKIVKDNPIAKANEAVYEFLEGGEDSPSPPPEYSDQHNVTWKSALTMSKQELKESSDVIEGMLPIGVVLFAAPAKTGKTFFCMQMSNTIAKGGQFLGYQCHKGNVYYLAFEDPENNQIERLRNSSYEIEDGYDIEICSPYQNDFNLEEKIINYRYFNPNLKAVIVDTFEKIREMNERTYTIEYKELTYFHELGLKYHISIVLVMHTIKNVNYNNVFTNISGSAGTAAAADGLLMLLRNQQNPDVRMFYIDGKNIRTDMICLKQDEHMCFETIKDDTEVQEIDPDLMLIIRYVIEHGKYCGSLEKLGVAAHVSYNKGVHLRWLLDHNKIVLETYFIRYTNLRRSTHSRQVSLVYYGDDDIDDTNDSNDAMTQF